LDSLSTGQDKGRPSFNASATKLSAQCRVAFPA